MTSSERDAAIARLVRVADALPADVRAQLTFIGGSVLPLLVDVDARFDSPRVTKDVDAVMLAVSYTRYGQIEDSLRRAGFRHDLTGPVSRWLTPGGELFDLASAGEHAGGTGAAVDLAALETAEQIPEISNVRCVSGFGFLVTKLAAFRDRGAKMPHASKDLADLAVLLVGRATLVSEVSTLAPPYRQFVRGLSAHVLDAFDVEGALRAHFSDRRPIPPETPAELCQHAIAVLRALAREEDQSST